MPEKSKLIRKAKKVLAFYEHNFNITKPYKIILDTEVVIRILQKNIAVKNQLEVVLNTSSNNFKLYITENTKHDITEQNKAKKGEYQKVVDGFDEFEVLPSTKKLKYPFEFVKQLTSGGQSIAKLLGQFNPEKYMVATDRSELRKYITTNYVNVPTLRVGHNFFILDDQTKNSEKAAHALRLQKIEILSKGPKKKTITKDEDKKEMLIDSVEKLTKKRKHETSSEEDEEDSENEFEKRKRKKKVKY
eukprot:gene6032-10034_t